MKILKRCLKKNNKGMSLVELVCSVAVLGLATTVVGGAVISSAESYQRGTLEVEVQQEAQLVTNLIGNLIVDSAETDYDTATKTLTIKSESTTHTIVYDETADTLEYTEATEDATGSVVSTNGLLASEVVNFVVDDSKFDLSKSVKVELTVKKNGKEYTAVYNTTARNGELLNGVGVNEYAEINIQDEVILEPNQTYSFPVTMSGMSAEQAGGLVWSNPTTGGSSVDASWAVSPSDTGATLKLGPNAEGTFWFSVQTNNKKKDADGNLTAEPLDYKVVTVKVRRVTGVTIGDTVTGLAGMSGTKYELAGNVAGTNLDKAFGGATYDNDYVSPMPVDFEFAMTGGTYTDYIDTATMVKDENSNTPKVTFTLKQTLPDNAKITVTATAKHPEGKWTDEGVENVTNKTSVAYGTVVATYEITKGASYIDSGIKRGDDYMVPTNVYNMYLGPIQNQCAADCVALYGSSAGVDADWLFRYRVCGSGESGWSKYIRMIQDGNELKLNAAETFLFHPSYGYDIEMILVGHKNNGDGTYDLLWPCNTDILENGRGLSDADGKSVFKQGWTTTEITPYSDYAVMLTVAPSSIMFNENTTYSTPTGAAVRSRTNPLPMYKTNPTTNSSDDLELTFTVVAMDTQDLNNNYRVDVMKFNASATGDNWPEVVSMWQSGNVTGQNFSFQAGSNYLRLNNITDSASGRYCIGICMKDVPLRTVDASDTLNPVYTEVKTDCELYTEDTGVIYVILNGAE